jgi:hypothetical protein
VSFLERLARDIAWRAIDADHDPATFDDPLDVSVRVRGVIEMLRKADPAHNDNYDLAADFIEREAREGRL